MSPRPSVPRSAPRSRWIVALAAMLLPLIGCGARGPTATLVIDDVVLIDGTDHDPTPGMSVAIAGDSIVAVGPTDRLVVQGTPTRVPGHGRYLIPGLWDMHVHEQVYGAHGFPLFLANGVTTIRDVGGDLDEVSRLRADVRSGRVLGPTIFMAGPILDDPVVVDVVPKGRWAVTTREDGRRAVDSLAQAGVDLVKVHSLTPRAAYFGILAAARDHGLFVAGHVPDAVSLREAIDSGQRTVEHAFGLAFENTPDGERIRREMLARAGHRGRGREAVIEAFDARVAAGDSAVAHYDSATAERFARYAASRPVWFDPTLVTIRSRMLELEPETRDFPELQYAPAAARGGDAWSPTGATPERIAAGRRSWQGTLQSLRALIREGARFVAGTDVPVLTAVPGFSLHRELGLLVDAGLSPKEAIQAATRNAAIATNRPELGVIGPGKVADLVLLRADPLASIGNVDSIDAVVTRGRLLDRAALARLLDDARTYAERP